jgi:hypothetical protein
MEKIIFEILKRVFKDSSVTFHKECPDTNACWYEDNSYGCLYNHSETIEGFTYTTESGLERIEPTLCGSSNNANGTRNTEYGIEMQNVKDGAFLIIHSVGSYSDCNGRDDVWNKVLIYSLKNLKEEREKAQRLKDEELMRQIKDFLS